MIVKTHGATSRDKLTNFAHKNKGSIQEYENKSNQLFREFQKAMMLKADSTNNLYGLCKEGGSPTLSE